MWIERHDKANKCFHCYFKMPKNEYISPGFAWRNLGKSDKNSAQLHDNHNKKSDLGTF